MVAGADDASGGLAGQWSRAAADYEQSGAEFFGPLALELVTRARLRPGDRVLDLGSGRGQGLFAAAEAVGPDGSVTGIDLAPEMVRLTTAEIADRGLGNTTIEVGDAGAPDLPPESVEVVLAGFMVFLLPDPVAALLSYHRVLAPGGRLAFSTFGETDERLAAVRAHLRHLADPSPAEPSVPSHAQLRDPAAPSPAEPSTAGHFDVFSDEQKLGELVRRAGFTDVLIAEVTVETRFDDLDQWWRWAWSVGIRGTLERIDPATLDRARPALEEHLHAWRQADGTYLMPTAVRFTTATRPAQPSD